MNAIRLLAAALALAAGAAYGQAGPEQKGPVDVTGRWGKNYTPGWALMTPKERREYRAKIARTTKVGDCKALVDQARSQAADRAKTKGMAAPADPPRDACAGLKP